MDEHLHLAQGGADLVDHAAHGGLVAHVGLHGQRLAACGRDRSDHVIRLVAAAAVVDDDLHAARCQQPGRRRADPPARARDEGDPGGVAAGLSRRLGVCHGAPFGMGYP